MADPLNSLGFAPEQFILNKRFLMPTASGGKNSIAIHKSNENLMISIYTILVGGAFMAWWILIATALPYVVTRRIRNTDAMQKVQSWDMTEPFQGAHIMARLMWRTIRDRPKRTPNNNNIEAGQPPNYDDKKGVSATTTAGTPPPGGDTTMAAASTTEASSGTVVNELAKSRSSLCLDLGSAFLVLVLAISTVAGGILGGIFLPQKMIIGQVAPVNPKMVYTLDDFFIRWKDVPPNLKADVLGQQSQVNMVNTKSVSRALRNVDSSLLDDLLAERISFTKTPAAPGPNEEQNYNINYKFRINGYEMGLQRLQKLYVDVAGSCSFQYDWYSGMSNGTVGISTDNSSAIEPSTDEDSSSYYDRYEWYKGEKWPLYGGIAARYGTVELGRYQGAYNVNRTDVSLSPSIERARVYPVDYADLPTLYPDSHPLFMGFAMIPGTQRRSTGPPEPQFNISKGVSDPWYTLGTPYPAGQNVTTQIALGRPALKCKEEVGWFYRGEYLGPRLALLKLKDSTTSNLTSTPANLNNTVPDTGTDSETNGKFGPGGIRRRQAPPDIITSVRQIAGPEALIFGKPQTGAPPGIDIPPTRNYLWTDAESNTTYNLPGALDNLPFLGFDTKLVSSAVDIPDGLWEIFRKDAHQPYVLSILAATQQGRLESSKRFQLGQLTLNQPYLNIGKASAEADLKRLVYAGYLLGRNRFRDAALAYIDPDLPAGLRPYVNKLQDAHGSPLPGVGDFVIPGDTVSTLRFEVVVAVPAVVAFSWLVVFVLLWFKQEEDKPYGLLTKRAGEALFSNIG